MTTSGESAILAALAALAEALTESGAPAMIIGGIAVIARGVPRQTVDVDATVWGDATSIEALVEVFRRHHIECLGELRIERLLLLHGPTIHRSCPQPRHGVRRGTR